MWETGTVSVDTLRGPELVGSKPEPEAGTDFGNPRPEIMGKILDPAGSRRTSSTWVTIRRLTLASGQFLRKSMSQVGVTADCPWAGFVRPEPAHRDL